MPADIFTPLAPTAGEPRRCGAIPSPPGDLLARNLVDPPAGLQRVIHGAQP